MSPKFCLIFILTIFCNILVGQVFSSEFKSNTLVLEAKFDHRTTKWSKDKNTIYTINYFRPLTILNGKSVKQDLIPVLIEGGEVDGKLLVVTHTNNVHAGFNYILALTKCNNCLENEPAYLINSMVGEFNKKEYLLAKKNWLSKPILKTSESIGCKGLDPSNSLLYIKLGNIVIDDPINQVAHIDIKARTNEFSKELNKIQSEVIYSQEVFGSNVIANNIISLSCYNNEISDSYTLISTDSNPNKFNFELEKKANSFQSYLVNTSYQPLLKITFDYSNIDFLALASLDAEEIIEFVNNSATFHCGSIIHNFSEVIHEKSPIGVSFSERSDSDLEFTIDNILIVNDNNYRFTIYADPSTTHLLRSSVIRVTYNANMFSQNVVSSGNATLITSTNDIINDFPIYEAVIEDDPLIDNIFRIVIGEFGLPSFNLEDYALLPNDLRTPIATVQLTINDCEQAPQLNFRELEMQGISFYHDPDGFAPFFMTEYNPIFANDLQNVLCNNCMDPVITGFSFENAELIAGNNEYLTITGSNFGTFKFGANPGMDGDGSSVLFSNADNSGPLDTDNPKFIGPSFRDYYLSDIIQWTDTEIKVKVPSTDYQLGTTSPAGTGKFIVRNGCNRETTSNEQINVKYALHNYRKPTNGGASKMGLRNENNPDISPTGYVLQFNPEVLESNAFDIEDAFVNALDKWCALTSINFKIGDTNDQNINATPRDNINSISIENIASDDAEADFTLNSTLYFDLVCPNDDSYQRGYMMTDCDFRIKTEFAANGNYDRMVRDFEHELGHAHMINHAYQCANHPSSCVGPVMHPQAIVTIQPRDVEGALRVFERSTEIRNNGGCNIDGNGVDLNPILPEGCGIIDGVTSKIEELLHLYPNPANTFIFVEGMQINSKITIINSVGKKLIEVTSSSMQESIDISFLINGVYFLVVSNESHSSTIKFIVNESF